MVSSCFFCKKGAGSVEEPAGWCYNLTAMKNQNTEKYNTPVQLKLPVDMAPFR